ncbi:DegT/DnrJ/EryC1/StrS family aminotransferase, partial [Rhizobium ruizarguesonis]
QYKGARAGSIGTSGCFSFYPCKNLGACGEGCMVVTNSDDQAKTMRMLRDWGQEQRYHHLLKGFNYRMDAIQGAPRFGPGFEMPELDAQDRAL